MQTIQIGLLGSGTVGSGVVHILRENRELLKSRTGIDLVLKWVADIDPGLLVSPPRGLEIGYVPIATRQGAE